MEHALLKVGLPVACALENCEVKGFVIPQTDYGGWYKSKLLRNRTKKWYCPTHADETQKSEARFLSGGYSHNTSIEHGVIYYDEATDLSEEAVDELYKLLD